MYKGLCPALSSWLVLRINFMKPWRWDFRMVILYLKSDAKWWSAFLIDYIKAVQRDTKGQLLVQQNKVLLAFCCSKLKLIKSQIADIQAI